jgi:hypothetical protein
MARRRQAEEGLFARELSESEVRSAREATTAPSLARNARQRVSPRARNHLLSDSPPLVAIPSSPASRNASRARRQDLLRYVQ